MLEPSGFGASSLFDPNTDAQRAASELLLYEVNGAGNSPVSS